MSKRKVLKKDVHAAEKAAQRSVCDLPDGPLPEDLKKALKRRVEVSWAAAKQSGVLRRLGGADEQVRELETPWSKRRPAATRTTPATDVDATTTSAGEPGDAPTPKPRGRSAKKTAAAPASDDTTQEGTV